MNLSSQLSQPSSIPNTQSTPKSYVDSTVLAHVMTTLNARYNYGLDLTLLSIDEGITGYRDDSLLTVAQNSKEYALPLTILSYQDLYGYTMDEIVAKVGRKSNCTFLHLSK